MFLSEQDTTSTRLEANPVPVNIQAQGSWNDIYGHQAGMQPNSQDTESAVR